MLKCLLQLLQLLDLMRPQCFRFQLVPAMCWWCSFHCFNIDMEELEQIKKLKLEN